MVDLPRDHRITAKPVGEARLESVSADGTELEWDRQFGLQHYECSCGEPLEGPDPEAAIIEHLVDEGVLDWDEVDAEVLH